MSLQVPQENERQSAGKGFGVAASPLNSVKLELGIILFAGLLLWLAVDSITADLSNQLLILLGYSVTGGLWLVLRTRRILRQLAQNNRDDEHETQQE